MFSDHNFEKGSEGNMDYLRVGTKNGMYVGIKPLMRQGGMYGPSGIGYCGKALMIGFRVRVSGPNGATEATASFPNLSENFLKKSGSRCSFMKLHTISTTTDIPDKAQIDDVFSKILPQFLDALMEDLTKDDLSFEQRKNQLLQYCLSKLQPTFDKMYGSIPEQFMKTQDQPQEAEKQEDKGHFDSLMKQPPLGGYKAPPMAGGSDHEE